VVKRLLPHHMRVLTELDAQTEPGEICVGFAHISLCLEMDRSDVRRIVRHLARRNLAEFHKGLCDDDGMFRGSGYCISHRGRAVVAAGDVLPEEHP